MRACVHVCACACVCLCSGVCVCVCARVFARALNHVALQHHERVPQHLTTEYQVLCFPRRVVATCSIHALWVLRRVINRCVLIDHDSLAKRRKAMAQGATTQGRGFEPRRCHCGVRFFQIIWIVKMRAS